MLGYLRVGLDGLRYAWPGTIVLVLLILLGAPKALRQDQAPALSSLAWRSLAASALLPPFLAALTASLVISIWGFGPHRLSWAGVFFLLILLVSQLTAGIACIWRMRTGRLLGVGIVGLSLLFTLGVSFAASIVITGDGP